MSLTEQEFNKLSEKERLNSILEGTFYWTWLAKPKVSEKYKNMEYTVNLVLNEENQKKALAMGLKIHPADKYTPGPWVKLQRKVKDQTNPQAVKPEVVDSMQKKVSDDLLIGNESQGLVKFGRYWYPNNGGGIGTVIFKVQIRKLVEFKAKDSGLVMDETGFVSEPEEKAKPISEEFDL